MKTKNHQPKYTRRSFLQTPDRWKELEKIATIQGAKVKSGPYAGNPSISALLRMLADGDLVVSRKQ